MVPPDVCDAKQPVLRPSGGPEIDVTVFSQGPREGEKSVWPEIEEFWKDYRKCSVYFQCVLAPQTSHNIA